MSSYRKSKGEAEQASGEGYLPCRKCGTATPWETLSSLGAQCQSCFDAYCALPVPEFSKRIRSGSPNRVLPRKPIEIDANSSHIGTLLAKKSSHEQVRQYADEMGIDVGDA